MAKKPNWIPLLGQFIVTDNEVEFDADTTVSQLNRQINPRDIFGLIKSDQYFENGTVSVKVYLESPECRAQIVLNEQSTPAVYCGINVNEMVYGIATRVGSEYKNIRGSLYVNNLIAEKWIDLKVEVRGSNISLFVDGVNVCSASLQISKNQVALFAGGPGKVKFKDFKCDSRKATAFVVMQFSDKFNELFKEVIRPTCERFGYETIRADDIYNCGQIINDIMEQIKESSLVVADISPDNPNVFYEVGFSHGVGTPTVLLCDKKARDHLPFDISGFRTVFYEDSIGGKSRIEDLLSKHLENINKS